MADDSSRLSNRDRWAFAISAASSPFIVLPVFMTVLAWHVSGDPRQVLLWTTLPALTVVGVPALYILFGVRRGRLTDLHVQLREQRRGPFMAAILGAAAGFALLQVVHAPAVLSFTVAAAVLNGALMLLITLRWKISMHPSVLTACALMAGRLVHPGWYLALLALPAVVWARRQRGRHTVAQGVAGIVVSTLVTIGLVGLYLSGLPGSG